jgi:hypothetical protein
MKDTPEEDIQIGVVSWAVNCANPVLPMVGARTSMPATASFIRNVACEIGTNVPYYLCDTSSDAVNSGSAADMINPVPLSVNLYFDPYPHEISFTISNTAKTMYYVSVPFEDHIGVDHAFHQVILPAGEECLFTIHDARDDGIFGDVDTTAYEIAYGKTIILKGNGKFTSSRDEIFRVPVVQDDGTIVINGTPVSDGSGGTDNVPITLPAATGSMTVFVYFEFDQYQEDLSWSISDAADGSIVYKRVEPNTYRFGTQAREEVNLPAGRAFHFTVNDRRGTDEFRAFKSYRLSYLDDSTGNEVTLLDNQGAFTGESETNDFSLPGVAQYQQEVSLQPPTTTEVQGELMVGDGASSPAVIVSQPAQQETICIDLLEQCEASTSCCSGRCVGGMCRKSQTTSGRNRSGLRLGLSRAGGAASSRAVQPP